MNAKALRLTQNRWGFIAFMSVMCALSPFAMSFIVPAFPGMADEFGHTVAEVQFLISVFLIGLGVAQPLHGLLADRYGRRPVLLTGFAIFTLASLASTFTTSWTALVICRFLQAVGVSAGTVISRAIVNDIQPRQEAAITLSYISMAMGVGPILAPVAGGLLNEAWNWRAIFVGCAVSGAVIWGMALFRLPETRPKSIENRKTVSQVLSNYRFLLTNPQFLGYTAMFGFGQGVFFAYLPFAPDWFENILKQPTSVFVGCWIALSLAFMSGSWAGTRLTKRYGFSRTLMGASLWLIVSVGVMALTYTIAGDDGIAMTGAMMVAMLGTGLICPLSLAGSISVDPKLAGTAAGLSSSLGLILGGLFAVISGVLYNDTLWPFIILAVVAVLGNLFAVNLTRRGEVPE